VGKKAKAMKQCREGTALSRYGVPIAAYLMLALGCYYAFWGPVLPEISSVFEKIAYIVYWPDFYSAAHTIAAL
jgi:hypothetical protein